MPRSLFYTQRALQNSTGVPSTVVLFGDSLVQYNSDVPDAAFGAAGTAPTTTSAGTFSKGLFENIHMRLGAPLTVLANLGIAGETTSQILARLPQALSLNAGWVWLSLGSNDPFAGIPTATSIATITTILNALRRAGLGVVIQSILPRAGASTAQIQQIMALNTWFRDQANVRGFLYVDLWSVFSDYSTVATHAAGTPASGTMLDGIHPTPQAATLAGVVGARSLRGTPLAASIPSRRLSHSTISGGGDADNVVLNPQMIQDTGGSVGAGGSGTVPRFWSVSRFSGTAITATASIVTRASLASLFPLFDDGQNGFFLKLALGNSAGTSEAIAATASLNTASLASLSGPWIGEAEIGLAMTSGTLAEARLRIGITASPQNFTLHANFNQDGVIALTRDAFVLRTRPFYLPAGVSGGDCRVVLATSTGAVGDVYVGRVSLVRGR